MAQLTSFVLQRLLVGSHTAIELNQLMPFMCLPVGYLICRYSRMQGCVCSSPGKTGVLPSTQILSLAPQWQPTEDGRDPRDGAMEHGTSPAIQYAPGAPTTTHASHNHHCEDCLLPLSTQITMLPQTATVCSHPLIAIFRSTVTAARAVRVNKPVAGAPNA